MAVYDLNTDLDRERVKRRIKALFEKRSMVEFKEIKPRRTTSQNSYLHVILGEFAMQTGYRLEYVKREYFKRECNADLFVRKKMDPLLHKETEELRSSKELDTAEMTIAIDRFRNWSVEVAGIDLPDAEDHVWINYIEREMQHQRIWI